MKPTVEAALRRIGDVAWVRSESAHAPEMQQRIISAAETLGYTTDRFRLKEARPYFSIGIDFSSAAMTGTVAFFGYVLAKVFYVMHHVSIPNATPKDERLDDALECELQHPPTRAASDVERDLTRVFSDLGWSRISQDERHERAPGFVRDWTVMGALGSDPYGCLDDKRVEDRHDADVLTLRDNVAAIYADPEGIATSSRATPAWQGPVERLAAECGRYERLTPANYPSVGWTIDFGEVHEGAFHARFLTDIYASKLAPTWFFAHRFIVNNPDPEPRIDPLEGWSVGEIGYTRTQNNCLRAIREQLGSHGLIELDPRLVTYGISPTEGSTEYRTFSEWLFRDPRGLADPAPRLEEEHPNREIRIRRGGLRG